MLENVGTDIGTGNMLMSAVWWFRG